MSTHHVIPLSLYYRIFAALLVLLVATVAAAFVDLGRLNLPVAMLIATVKAVLVILYFMHVRYSSRLTWVFAGAAFLWLAILLVLTLNDYVSRPWMPVDSGWPAPVHRSSDEKPMNYPSEGG